MLLICWVVDCAVREGRVGRIRRIAPPSGIGLVTGPESAMLIRPMNGLFLRSQRFFYPAVELLLVGFDPAINVALNVSF